MKRKEEIEIHWTRLWLTGYIEMSSVIIPLCPPALHSILPFSSSFIPSPTFCLYPLLFFSISSYPFLLPLVLLFLSFSSPFSIFSCTLLPYSSTASSIPIVSLLLLLFLHYHLLWSSICSFAQTPPFTFSFSFPPLPLPLLIYWLIHLLPSSFCISFFPPLAFSFLQHRLHLWFFLGIAEQFVWGLTTSKLYHYEKKEKKYDLTKLTVMVNLLCSWCQVQLSTSE